MLVPSSNRFGNTPAPSRRAADRAHRKMQWQRTLARLQALYPKAFCKDRPSPLKVDVFEDIMARIPDPPPRYILAVALKHWVRRKEYRAAMVEGARRYDLDGKVAGVVTPADAAHAKLKK